MAFVEEEDQAGIPEWVVTFGDMMSLLLTFFIMLVSMSEIKEQQRFQALMESMRKSFGYHAATISTLPGNFKPHNSAFANLASLGRARRANTMRGGDKVRAPVGDYPRVQALRPAEHQTIGGVISFKEGSAELDEEQKQILLATVREIGGKPQKIEIRGHTSTRPLPPDSPYKSHWDLAYARCVNTMDFLVKFGINPKRIRISVAGENEPRHIKNDPLLLKKNPRVEVFMLDELTGDFEGTPNEKLQRVSTRDAP